MAENMRKLVEEGYDKGQYTFVFVLQQALKEQKLI